MHSLVLGDIARAFNLIPVVDTNAFTAPEEHWAARALIPSLNVNAFTAPGGHCATRSRTTVLKASAVTAPEER